jgi:hypothetical protein
LAKSDVAGWGAFLKVLLPASVSMFFITCVLVLCNEFDDVISETRQQK